MVLRHARGKITWIDMESPTQEELADVMREFDIDPRVEEEIISPTVYPLFIPFADYLYLVLHFPTAAAEGGARNQEIDFIVGKSFIITARYEVIDSIHNLHKVFEAEELLGLPDSNLKTEILLERIFRRLYSAIGSEIEATAQRLERIEKGIFGGKERAMVRTISEVGRMLLRFETALSRHGESLKAFVQELATSAFFGKTFSKHAVHIEAERAHVANLVVSYRAVAKELRDTNDSLLSTSQNEIMKVLTVIAFVTYPLTLVASVFGMNAEHMPFVGSRYDFWIIISIMIALGITLFSFFRFKRWL
ncbi:MAG: CorA family divalent cation transporter [Minisyncoccia bacterium]